MAKSLCASTPLAHYFLLFLFPHCVPLNTGSYSSVPFWWPSSQNNKQTFVASSFSGASRDTLGESMRSAQPLGVRRGCARPGASNLAQPVCFPSGHQPAEWGLLGLGRCLINLNTPHIAASPSHEQRATSYQHRPPALSPRRDRARISP